MSQPQNDPDEFNVPEGEVVNYGKHVPKPTDSRVAELEQLVADAAYSQELIDSLERRVAQERVVLKQLKENTIPELMTSCGLLQITTKQGLTIKISRELYANIPSVSAINEARDAETRAALIQRRNAAFQWLSENGHASIIGHKVTVEFEKGDEMTAKELVQDLTTRDTPLHVVEGKDVHYKTLQKLLKQLRKDGVPFPEATFGLYEPTIATFGK